MICAPTNSEHRFFDVVHFQIGCMGKKTGDKLANVFAVLSGCMLAGAREAAKNMIFLLWIDGPHLIVDFGVTVQIGCHHYAQQMLARLALLVAAYHLIPSLDPASDCWRKKDCPLPALSRRGSDLEHANWHHRSSQGFGFRCR